MNEYVSFVFSGLNLFLMCILSYHTWLISIFTIHQTFSTKCMQYFYNERKIYKCSPSVHLTKKDFTTKMSSRPSLTSRIAQSHTFAACYCLHQLITQHYYHVGNKLRLAPSLYRPFNVKNPHVMLVPISIT